MFLRFYLLLIAFLLTAKEKTQKTTHQNYTVDSKDKTEKGTEYANWIN